MADNTNTPTQPTPEEVAAANAETAQKLKDQGADLSKPGNPDDFRETAEGLDAIASEIAKKKEAETPIDDTIVKPVVTPTPPADDEAAKKAAAEAEAKAAEAKAAEERAETFFKDAPKLPPNASTKSTEAFRDVKLRAMKDISDRDAEIEKLKKEIAARDEKLKNPLTPEAQEEIKSLREFKAKLDVESDPKFKEFDKNADATREFIYAQIRQNPNVQADKLIEKIKSFGGPEMVQWKAIFEGMNDPTAQRIIESSLAEIEKVKFLKSQAIQNAKKNVDEYVKTQAEQATKAATSHRDATKAELALLTPNLDFLKEKPVDEKADESTRKGIESENAWVKETNGFIQQALNDDSPQMRALQIAGMAQLLWMKRVRDAEQIVHQRIVKENEEMKETIKKFKGASVNRIRETGGAPTDGRLPQPKKAEDTFNVPTTQALDDLAKQIQEKRAAAAV